MWERTEEVCTNERYMPLSGRENVRCVGIVLLMCYWMFAGEGVRHCKQEGRMWLLSVCCVDGASG